MEPCPCGSEMEFDACCKPFLMGEQHARTAEALMRARYTAHVKANHAYIYDTTHPDNRNELDREKSADWSKRFDWQSLEILRTESGENEDLKGTVEFVARYRKKGTLFRHHEIAEFERHEDRWYFKDGQVPVPEQAVRKERKVGRNESCPCGSGKKYKKCCGR